MEVFYMKRIFKGLISFILCFSLTVPAFALTENEADKISYLNDKGFPIELLEILRPEKLNELYIGVKDGTILYGGTSTKKLSEEGDIVPYRQGDIDYLNVGITHTFNMDVRDDGTAKINSVEMYVHYEWPNGKQAAINKTDTIAVNWDSSLFYATGFSAESGVFLEKGGYVELDSWSSPAELTQGGLGYLAELHYGQGAVESRVGYANFDLKARSPMYYAGTYGETYNTSVNLQYVHCDDPGNVTVGFNIGVFSVSGDISGSTESTAIYTDFPYSA